MPNRCIWLCADESTRIPVTKYVNEITIHATEFVLSAYPPIRHRIYSNIFEPPLFSRIYMSKYHFNNFGGLVLFSLPPKRFFARFLMRGTQEDPSVHYPLRMRLARRRWCVYWPPKVAWTGSIFRGYESEPKKPSPRHENWKRNTFKRGVYLCKRSIFQLCGRSGHVSVRGDLF